jgi:hypothetical protein
MQLLTTTLADAHANAGYSILSVKQVLVPLVSTLAKESKFKHQKPFK